MRIQHLEINKLYGFIDKKIEFNSGINFLVGINGSGKTSVLNILNWIQSLSIADLAVLDYESIILRFEKYNKTYELKLLKNDLNLVLDLNSFDNNKLEPIIVPLINNKIYNIDKLTFNNIKIHYQGLSPEDNEMETWKTLKKILQEPINIGLNRNLISNISNDKKLDNNNNNVKISWVEEIAKEHYSKYRTRIINLNKKLNNSIMISAFDKIYSETELKDILSKETPSKETIDRLKEKIIIYFKENNIMQSIEKDINEIERYFSEIKSIVSPECKKEMPLSYLMNVNQIEKIRSLINEFKNFEEELFKISMITNNYLEIVNSFLIDSYKRIYFHKSTGDLRFNVFNSDGKDISRDNHISNLSSGEQQILLQFTYLCLLRKKDSITMIDEPELSLHPRWLENYIRAIKKISVNDNQIIIATHSPVIVSELKENCIVLFPF